MTMRGQARRRQARRSTWTGLAGVGLMVLGLVLTALRVVGDVVPTVLAVVGLLLLLVGLGTGSLLVLDNFRYRRDQSYYDPDEEDDE